MEWSSETYRLDEIESRVQIPCVIHVNEGFYAENDADGFSQGDIIGIDRKMTLHKVAAHFSSTKTFSHSDYIDLYEEILVPLNYKGKLTVVSESRKYDSIRDLAMDSPRYATVLSNLRMNTGENHGVEVVAGTKIELDRTLPGASPGQERLVIKYEHLGKNQIGTVPFNTRVRVRSEVDHTEYTIKEAIDRYALPQLVQFVDDQIKKVYTQDLLEGIENMHAITETLQLNRLVTQDVLVGHYKPVGDHLPDTEHFKKRTLVVLPLNEPMIRDIEVNVLKGVDNMDDLYEDIFLVRNVSHDLELVDALYVEFAARPRMQMLGTNTPTEATAIGGNLEQETEPPPPPVPPRKGSNSGSNDPQKSSMTASSQSTVSLYSNARQSPNHPVNVKPARSVQPRVTADSEDDDYIVPDPPSPVTAKAGRRPPSPVSKTSSCSASFDIASLADVSSGSTSLHAEPSMFSRLMKKPGQWFSSPTSPTSRQEPAKISPMSPTAPPILDLPDEHVYDAVEDPETARYKTPPPKQKSKPIKALKPVSKPTAHVTPSSQSQLTTQKATDFTQLSCNELVDRLKQCHMTKLAGICEDSHFDGSFFKNVSDKELSDDFKLSRIDIIKFKKMRDDNWVVNE